MGTHPIFESDFDCLTDMTSVSIVEWFGGESGHKCGYCKGESGSLSDGMWAHIMTPEDYQRLIDRGWRRSGKYCYKPDMRRTCCPQYTIRCLVQEMKISRTQKRVISAMNDFLNSGKKREIVAAEPKDGTREQNK